MIDPQILLGLMGAVIVTILLILWCHNNMACGECKDEEESKVPVSRGARLPPTAAGYVFQNTGGPFKIVLNEKSEKFPQTPSLTLYVNNKGEAIVSSAMTIYKPRIRRHNVRYNKNPTTGDETAVPVSSPNTYWATYNAKEGLQLGLGDTPTPYSTLVIGADYVPLGVFSMEIQGNGITGMQAIPELPPNKQACTYRLKKPYE